MDPLQIQFTEMEQAFVDTIMGCWQPENYDVYVDMVQAIIEKQLSHGTIHLVDLPIKSMLESIRYKIFDYRASVEIEKMLGNPSYQLSTTRTHKVGASAKFSTKAQSLAKVNIGPLAQRVLDLLQVDPDLTRREIANKLNITLQSVCGRISELKNMGLVWETGTKYDEETERNVTTLSVAKQPN